MQLQVSFKNLRPRDEVKQRAEVLFKKLERFLDPAAEGRMLVNVEHSSAVIELVVSTRGEVHKVEVEDTDLRTAIDKVFHTMEVTLRRSKERTQDRRHTRQGREDGFVEEGGVDDEEFDEAI